MNSVTRTKTNIENAPLSEDLTNQIDIKQQTCPMAGALIRRKVRESEGLSVNDDDRDAVPSYLLELPVASSRIKDLNLAVLLGRQVNSNFITTWTASKV